jgi:GT2 family glycosyltransferase
MSGATPTGEPDLRAPAVARVGVFVLGMHRSGTSAVTRLVNLLGVPICHEEDLIPATTHNPRGHWESDTLVRVNDNLLSELGRAWWCPPRLGTVWNSDVSEAREQFRAVHPSHQWVWKDPRTCITLPFWLSALPERPVAILTVRNPLEIAASLETRNDFPTHASLALWERYMHHVLTAIAGLPTATVRFEDLIIAPVQTAERLQAFLSRHGIVARLPGTDEIVDFIDPQLRHGVSATNPAPAGGKLSGQQAELAALLDSLPGRSPSFVVPELPLESPKTDGFFTRVQDHFGLRKAVAARRQRPAQTSVIVSAPPDRPPNDEAIRSLIAAVPRESEVILVGDGSPDWVVSRRRRLRAVRARSVLGYAQARNLGASEAQGEVLVFADPQAIPRARWLTPLLKAVGSAEVAAAAPTLIDARAGKVRGQGLEFADADLKLRWVRRDGGGPFPLPLLCGSLIAVRRDAFVRVGGFDAGFVSPGCEDLELSMRLWRRGYECVGVPAAGVSHRWSPSPLGNRNRVAVLTNLIRLANLHLSGEYLAEFINRVGGRKSFPRAYAHVLAGDALRRRRELQALSPYDDRWFLERFGMNPFGRELQGDRKG